MFTKDPVTFLIASLLAVAVANEEDCVSNYNEFQDATFSKSTPNQFELHRVFYPPNGRKPYSVEVTYQTTLSNGTVVDIITDGAGYSNKVWVWLSSPIFLYQRPEFLNSLVLKTLNNFVDWIPPSVNITVPRPCESRKFDFLEAMTATLSDHASYHTNMRTESGNVVVKIIHKDTAYYFPFKKGSTSTNTKAERFLVFLDLCAMGFVLLVALLWAVFVFLVKFRMRKFVDRMTHYSYQYYGLAWGGCVITIGLSLALWIGIVKGFMGTRPDVDAPLAKQRVAFYALSICCLVLFILPGIPIAVYFAYKTTPPPVPYIFLLPAALLCCCKTRYAQSMVFGLGLFLYMTGLQIIMGTVIVAIFVVVAKPLLLITNMFIIILLAFCLTNIFALLFTISAYIFTARDSRRMQKLSIVLKAAILLLLFAAIALISFALAANASMISSNPSSVLSMVGSAMVPIVIGALMFALKTVVVKVLDIPYEPLSGDVPTSSTSLLGRCDRDSVYGSINTEP